MSDTIEWLETIGKNACLRHASAETLAQILTDASDTLKAAVLSGDSSLLSAELGDKRMGVEHNPHAIPHEEEEQKPNPDKGKQPQPPKPDPDKPAQDR